MAGWIYDFRQELDSTVWQMPPMYHRVWQYLKYSVNHSPARIPNKDGTFTNIAPGQHATSYRHLAKGVGYYEGIKWKEPNPKTIKSILDWLVTQNMITVCGNTYGTIVTIVNWSVYQSEKVKGNAKETEKKHFVDTNNKELINDESMINKQTEINDFFQSCWSMYPRKEGKGSISDKTKKERFKLGDEFIRCIERYNAKIKKDKTEPKYIMQGSTFWNSGYVDYLDSSQDVKEIKPIVFVERDVYE
jgi:hypothetical protein